MALTRFRGRRFRESQYYDVVSRNIAHMTKNKVWLTTVEKVYSVDDDGNRADDTQVRIRKWRARIEEEGDKETSIWTEESGVNIKNAEIADNVMNYVYSALTSPTSPSDEITIDEEEYEELKEKEDEAEEFKKEVKRLKEINNSARKELEAYRRRVELMKENKDNYKDNLHKLGELIKDENTTETEIHSFFTEENLYWIFGLEYVELESEFKFPPGEGNYRFDIMLSRHDEFYDLVELKGPNENLFDQRTKHRTKPNQKLSEAVGQVFTYLRACEEQNLDDIFKPRARIVIGKDKTDDLEERRLFSSYLNNVEVLTYTDLLDMGKEILDHLESI